LSNQKFVNCPKQFAAFLYCCNRVSKHYVNQNRDDLKSVIQIHELI